MVESVRHSPHFEGLSDELIVQILHFCGYDEILRFATTCKRHYSVLSNSVSLKLHIELDVNGLGVVKGSRRRNGTYAQLLDELVRYRDAWLNLDLEESTERTSNQVMSLWELREGNYVVAFSSTPTSVWGPDSMQLTPIGSSEAPQPITFPSVFHEFTLDFEQQLAALVKTDPNDPRHLEIRLCSTITGLPHPLARNPIFTIRVDFQIPGPGHQTFTLEIIDNILVTRIADIMHFGYEVIAWDWKADFSLLDNTYLALLAAEVDGQDPRLIALSLYSMHPYAHDETTDGAIFCASQHSCARPVISFEFPKLHSSYKLSSRIIMRSDPIPGRTTFTKSASFAYPTSLTFSAILSLLHLTSEDEEDSVHLRIFISARSLLSYLPDSPGEEGTVVVPWEVWGPQATRWFLCDKQTNYWVYWTSGSRFVRVDDSETNSELHSLSIFEFHPPIVRRHALRSAYDPTEHQNSVLQEERRNIILEGRGLTILHPGSPLSDDTGLAQSPIIDTVDSDFPTIIKSGFSVPVESRLPYRVVTRPKFVPSREDWSMDGDHIIGMAPIRRNVDLLTVYKLRT